MADDPASKTPAVYALLPRQANLAVEAALLGALPALEPHEQAAALDVLVARNRTERLVPLVGQFQRFDPAVQELILARAGGLYGAARLAVSNELQETRLGAIEFLRRCGDCKLVYLLADALRQPCPKTREQAAAALVAVTAEHLRREDSARNDHTQATNATALRNEAQYLARALKQAVLAWDLHLRPEVLSAAIWMVTDLEQALFEGATAPRSKLARALQERMYAADHPRIAGFAIRALACPALRNEAARTIETAVHPAFVEGLMAESWLLADPEIARAWPRVRRLAWLEEGEDKAHPSPTLEQLPPGRINGALRLMAGSGLASEVKVGVLDRFLGDRGTSREARSAAFWNLVEIKTETATRILRGLARNGDDPLRAAARCELFRRGVEPPRDRPLAGESRWTPSEQSRPGEGATRARLHPPGASPGDRAMSFDELWRVFDSLEGPDQQRTLERVRRESPDFAVRLRSKLGSGHAADRSQALRMIRSANLTRAFDEQIYAAANEADPVVRSLAVVLLGQLEGGTARLILRRALEDSDARVQANAVEALDALGTASGEPLLEAKLRAAHPRVRANAVAALLKRRLPEAGEALLTMLESPQRDQRISALWVVERLRLSSLLQRLLDLSQRDPDPQVRRRAARILRVLAVANAAQRQPATTGGSGG